MKKLSFLFIALALSVAAVLGTVFTACDNPNGPYGKNKSEYSVTVLDDDDVTAISGVTVKWSQSGKEYASAVTDANGKATANIAAASYDVTLANLPEGMTYTPASVTSTARGITLVLEKSKVDYTATVNKSDNTPASGVTVTWTANNRIAGTATTGADGKATKNLVYGNYSVTVSNLPGGQVFVGSQQVTGAQPDAVFTLASGQTTDYTVSVKSEGGLKFKKQTVSAYNGEEMIASAETDDDGNVTFALSPDYTYTVAVQNVPEGYTYTPATLNSENTTVDLTLFSEVIKTEPASDTSYVIGDIIHDYEFTTPYKVNGNNLTYKISEILKTKKAIVLNFWGTNCSACMLEMPAMQQAYEIYSNDVEFIAVSNYMGGDSNATIESFRNQNKYTFPMFRDTHSFDRKFVLTAWPTNVIIDRYGAIARIEDGALTSLSFWEKLLDQYTDEDYIQTFVPGTKRNDSTVIEMAKPDITVEADHYEKVGAAINSTDAIPAGCSISWFGEPEETAEFTWPFILKTLDDYGTVLYPSNSERNNTYSFIYADITMTAGKVFTFDYWAQTEADNDIFYVLFDGKVVYQISGENSGWKTCYVYADVVNGSHQLALSYIKDESRGAGFDNVYIKNARFTELSEITDSTDMLRGAAYGTPQQGATSYPYYAPVAVGQDGYYHVKLSEMVGAQYAGNDESPLLFANLLTATNWAPYSVSDLVLATDETTGEYLISCTFKLDGVTSDWRELLVEYADLASKSDINGYIPVDEFLKKLLSAFAAHISGNTYQTDEWLEMCYYFSHYGSGDPIGNPIIGLTESTAIAVTEGTHTADLTRLTAPYPITRFAFTPERSGVFTIESLIPESQASLLASQVWIYTSDIDNPIYYSGDDRIFRTGENEQNFVANLYLTQGRKYYIAVAYLMTERGMMDFKITYAGDSVEVLSTCTSGDYRLVGDHMELRYAVNYKADADGYYHVLNSDGSLGDFIYLDFKYSTLGNNTTPLSKIINQYIFDPMGSNTKLYQVFDFTKTIAYETYEIDDEGNASYNYAVVNPADYDKAHANDYIDYTDKMKDYCNKALANTGREEGMIKVNDELVKILTIYHLLRTDSIIDGVMPYIIENEWLRFCWYYKTIDADNPV